MLMHKRMQIDTITRPCVDARTLFVSFGEPLRNIHLHQLAARLPPYDRLRLAAVALVIHCCMTVCALPSVYPKVTRTTHRPVACCRRQQCRQQSAAVG